MAAHQNAAKRLKALLRRTHFPVSRLKQIRGSSVGQGGDRETGGGVGNPWVGIVDGDPRAALVVLHWTLLDMSQLFSSNLLDRGYSGLQSLTDYKFVSKSLRMLREEFNCRSQLTAEQFLTQGFAEVKMRLLADIVEIVIRTHTSLSKLQGGGSRKPKESMSVNTESLVSAESGWGVRNDGAGNGSLSPFPWTAPIPISQQSSRPGSADSRDSGGDQLSDCSARPRSPPRLSGDPVSVGSSRACGSIGAARRQPTNLSPSTLSDEQNAPPLMAPASIHAPVPRDHHWHADRSPSYYAAEVGAAIALDGVAANGGGASLWLRDPECFKRLRESVMQSSRRSPLGPRSAQDSLHKNSTEVDAGAATTTRHDASAASAVVGNHGKGRPDWHAVEQVLGSFDDFQAPSSPPAVVPSSPSMETGVPRLSPPSMSSAVTPRMHTSLSSSRITAESGAFPGREGAGSDAINPLGRDSARTHGALYESEKSCGSFGEAGTGHGTRQERDERCRESSDRVTAELAKMKQQIEVMLEQHARLFESKIKETEQVLSARLTLLEIKVRGLEVGSPVRS